MATLAVQAAAASGVALSTVAAAGGGDVFSNNGKTVLFVNNGGGGSITVTITPQNTLPGGYALANVAVTLTAGQAKYLGTYDPQYFNNSNGQVAVTYSGVTSVTVGALSVG